MLKISDIISGCLLHLEYLPDLANLHVGETARQDFSFHSGDLAIKKSYKDVEHTSSSNDDCYFDYRTITRLCCS